MANLCKSCGAEIEENANNCSRCGAAVDKTPQNLSENTAQQSITAVTAQQPVIVQSENKSYKKIKKNKKPNSYSYSVAAFIFGALGGYFGLIFGIMGLVTNKEKNKGVTVRCILGIVFFVLWMVVYAKQKGLI